LIARLLKACLHPFLFPAIPNLDLQSFTLQLHTLDPWLGAARVSSGSSAKDPAANLELDSKFIHGSTRHPPRRANSRYGSCAVLAGTYSRHRTSVSSVDAVSCWPRGRGVRDASRVGRGAPVALGLIAR
jgi:hypothetical protein